MKTFLRLFIGGFAILLYLVGRGIRVNLRYSYSPMEYTVSVIAQVVGAALAVLVFVVWRVSRLSGPRNRSSMQQLRTLGWLHLGMAALIVASSFAFVGMARSEGAVGALGTAILSTPDLSIKMAIALLVAATGAIAVTKARIGWSLIRLSAVPLAVIWPVGFMVGAWSAWSSIGQPESGTSAVGVDAGDGEPVPSESD